MPYGTEYMLRQPGTRAGWRSVRRLFAQTIGAIEPHSHVRWAAAKRALRRFPSRDERILEVATGSGEMALEIRSLLHPRLLTTFDLFVPNAIIHDSCACIRADATHIPILSGTQDRVIALDVIEHIPQDRDALREMHRVLASGGHLFVSVPTPAYPRYFGRPFHDSLGHVRDGYTREGLIQALADGGFDIVDVKGHTNLLFLLFAFLYYRRLKNNVFAASIAVALSRPLVWIDPWLPSPIWGGLIASAVKRPPT